MILKADKVPPKTRFVFFNPFLTAYKNLLMSELNVFRNPSVRSFFSLNNKTWAETYKKSSAEQIVPH